MTKSKQTKSALFSSVVALLLCFTMLLGTTFAWFTDNASSSVNKIQAGTLDIQLLDASGNSLEDKTLSWQKAAGHENEEVLWEPGCTYNLQTITIKNNGNLALKYKIEITGIQGNAKLNKAIDWKITNSNTVSELGADHSLAAGASDTLTISGTMKTTAGNEYQGLSIDDIAITVLATQDTVEYDSQDNQYDANALYYGEAPEGAVVVSSAEELKTAVAAGATTVYLEAGEYDVAECKNATLTINGLTEGVVIKVMNEGEDGCDYGFDNSTVIFNGVTIDTTANTGNYKGYARMAATFNNCEFVGAYAAFKDNTFNNCTFDFENGYFWTWGAETLNFSECTFNGNSKAILAHGGNSTTINIVNCAFAATEKGYTSSGDNTAAVEMDPTGTNTYTVNFSGNNTITEAYDGWTRVKDGSTGHIITGLN